MPLLADFKIRLNCLYPTFFSRSLVFTCLTNLLMQPRCPSCICCRLRLLHPVWSFSGVTALVKHPHTSARRVPSTANMLRPNILTWGRRTSHRHYVLTQSRRYISPTWHRLLLPPFLNTLGLSRRMRKLPNQCAGCETLLSSSESCLSLHSAVCND